jgi:cytochrome c biogenesis factor
MLTHWEISYDNIRMLATKEYIDALGKVWYTKALRDFIRIRYGPRLGEVELKMINLSKLRKIDLVQLYIELRQKYG